MKNRNNSLHPVIIFIICLLISFGAAALGSVFTSGGTQSEWYQSVKPSITPPGFVFPIAWNILFFLIAVSLFLAWQSANKKQRNAIILAYGSNLMFNVLWSLFYFGMQNPLLAFIDIILVWITILYTMIIVRCFNKTASWLLLPYLLWVTFASLLNYLSI